eukprot:gb/GEZJ01002054.1/.p1 GENE.gb/GEZJ01002054.1/~~gb/GEZJ01002054.1/.p1  ORF type:complete len:633 (+),score=57.22 gb/GEZJ01002054.1/:377-2275(+)
MPSPTATPNALPSPSSTSLPALEQASAVVAATQAPISNPPAEEDIYADVIQIASANGSPVDELGRAIHQNNAPDVQSISISGGSEAHSSSPVIKRRRTNRARSSPQPAIIRSNSSQEDGNCCTICLERWSTSGPHQVCCMPCGHLFGYSCIKEWILGGNSRKRECPTCKTPARVKELRYLFGLPSRLEVADVSEIQRLQDELKREKISHEMTKVKYEETKKLAKTYREEIRNLRRHAKSSVQTFGQEHPPQRDEPMDNVRLLSVHRTAGASLAVAVDQDASYLFNERVAGDALRHRIGRIDIGRPNVPVHSPHAAENRVNCIEICRHTHRADHRHIAIASTDNSVSILAPNLLRATTLRLPGIPLSCSWLSTHPHLLAIGLVSGVVLMYDVRQTSTSLYKSTLPRNQGSRAVHSLAEIQITGSHASSTILAAASPLGVFGITFDGYMDSPNVSAVHGGIPEEWASTSFTVSGNMIAVVARRPPMVGYASQDLECSLSMYRGLVKEGQSLTFGPSLGEPVYTASQSVPFVYCGIVEGNENYMDTILAYPDKNAREKLNVWALKRNTHGGGTSWKQQDVVSDLQTQNPSTADVRAAAGLRLPRTARINGVPNGSRGVFVTVGSDVIRLFAAGKY